MELKSYLLKRQTVINQALEGYLPGIRQTPGSIHQAMRYSVLGKGKRIRPILVLAACEAVGGKPSLALPAACAIELIHAYSLVHDDLPAMDNDDFRRGKPSTHKQFGEALGVLTGDALLTFSFELLSRQNHDSSMRLKVIREVARAIGTQGMIGGQVADVQAGRRIDPEQMEAINRKKTGALIAASVRIGAILGGASAAQYRALSFYGDRVGLVFQLVDDLLDNDGAVKVDGAEAVRRRADRLTRSAQSALTPLGARAEPLKSLAGFILTRGS
ncbi:MAG: polyprenyl synthetase family protein [Candidatus Omnitrophica bacterium]|nr:polyprenyl synthetase family protein [Candidatus Omnitrophota bacterium]